jgi:hypothetical protein
MYAGDPDVVAFLPLPDLSFQEVTLEPENVTVEESAASSHKASPIISLSVNGLETLFLNRDNSDRRSDKEVGISDTPDCLSYEGVRILASASVSSRLAFSFNHLVYSEESGGGLSFI